MNITGRNCMRDRPVRPTEIGEEIQQGAQFQLSGNH